MRTIEDKQKVQKLKNVKKGITIACLVTAMAGSALGIATAASGALLTLPAVQVVLLSCSILPFVGVAVSNAIINNRIKKYYTYDTDVEKSLEPSAQKTQQASKQSNISVVRFNKPKVQSNTNTAEDEPELS